MINEITYCNCSNYNNHGICTLLDNLRHIHSGTESFVTKENEANKFCSTCNSFKDIYSVYRRN
jgi:hypothetical protein